MSNYIAPKIEQVGSYRKLTNGVWFGRWRDIFGGRAFIKVTVGRVSTFERGGGALIACIAPSCLEGERG